VPLKKICNQNTQPTVIAVNMVIMQLVLLDKLRHNLLRDGGKRDNTGPNQLAVANVIMS